LKNTISSASQEIPAFPGIRNFVTLFLRARRLSVSWVTLYSCFDDICYAILSVFATLLYCLITQNYHSRHMPSKLSPMFLHIGYRILCNLFWLLFKRSTDI